MHFGLGVIDNANNAKTQIVYVLALYAQKYFVGSSDSPIKAVASMQSHFRGENASPWTRLYRPIGVIELLATGDADLETTTTKRYMKRFGIDRVRNSTPVYGAVELGYNAHDMLRKELNDGCYRCGEAGHYTPQCPKRLRDHGAALCKSLKLCTRCFQCDSTHFERCESLKDVFGNVLQHTEHSFKTKAAKATSTAAVVVVVEAAPATSVGLLSTVYKWFVGGV